MEMEMEMTKKSYTLFSVLTVFRIVAAQLSLKWVIRPNFRCIIPPLPLCIMKPFPPPLYMMIIGCGVGAVG